MRIQKKVPYKINGVDLKADVTIYEDGDKKLLRELYFKWLDLNKKLKEISTRGINIPETITENAFCLNFPDHIRVSKLSKGKCSFDALNIKTGSRVQIKASSIKYDLTSFGPRSEWDELYFLDFSNEDGTFAVYKINNTTELIYHRKMNETETFEDQQKAKKRPRFSIKQYIIEPTKLKPLKVFSL